MIERSIFVSSLLSLGELSFINELLEKLRDSCENYVALLEEVSHQFDSKL